VRPRANDILEMHVEDPVAETPDGFSGVIAVGPHQPVSTMRHKGVRSEFLEERLRRGMLGWFSRPSEGLVAHEFDRRSRSRARTGGKRAEDRRPQRVRDLARACRFGMRRSEVGAVDDVVKRWRARLCWRVRCVRPSPRRTEVRPPISTASKPAAAMSRGSRRNAERIRKRVEMLGHGGSTSSPATQKRVDRVVEDPAVELIADLPRDVAGRGERNSPGTLWCFACRCTSTTCHDLLCLRIARRCNAA